MRASDPGDKSCKKVCEDLPNLAILTKSATPGEFQLTLGHATVGNKSLGEYVVAFSLAGYLSSPSVVSLKIDIDFAAERDKIRLPIAEVLLRAAAGDLARSKKQWDWTPRNTVLLLSLLTEAPIIHEELDAGELQKIFARSITEWAKEGENASGKKDDTEKDSEDSVETEDEMTSNTGKVMLATANTLVPFTDDCNDVLAFLQAVAVKSPRVIAAPLSLRADKRERVWLCRWTDANLPTPP